jgi:glycosyltransferase involved in cell wall biosynthesis
MVVRLFSPSGGLEFYTYKLVEGLLKRNVYVTVICEQNESTLEHPHLTVQQFRIAPPNLGKAGKLNHYLNEATKTIAQTGPYDLVHSQHLPIEHADVVTFHNHTLARLSESGKLWERLVDLSKIHLNPAYRRRNETDKLLAGNAGALIFPSQTCKTDYEIHFNLLKHRDPASHVVAYPGVDLVSGDTSKYPGQRADSQLSQQCQASHGSQPITFLFVGKGFRRKGLDVLLSACRRLKAKGYRFRLLIAGMKETFTNKVRLRFSGLSDSVAYLGIQKQMQCVYPRAQVLILPSRVDTFGLAPLEAMALGLAPIVSRVSGISELLTHKDNALILQDHLDDRELASLMIELIEQPRLLKSLAARAVETAKEHTWDKTVDTTLSAYAQVLASKAPVSCKLPRMG